jgi:uncharacterized membrane protein
MIRNMSILAILFAVWALVLAASAKRRTRTLEYQMELMRRSLAGAVTAKPAPGEAETMAAAEPIALPAAPAMPAEPALAVPAAAHAAPKPAPPWRSLESMIGNRWGLWLGGLVLLLAAGFFVREAVANGWVGPVARCLALYLIGAAFLFAGRTKRLDRLALAGDAGWNVLRPILNAVGVAFLLAGLFAAGPHYGLISAFWFGVFMALVSGFGMTAARRFGAPVAVIGLLGGFGLPLLAGYSDRHVGAFLLYLLVLFITADISGRHSLLRWMPIAAMLGAVVDAALASHLLAGLGSVLYFLALSFYVLGRLAFTGRDNANRIDDYAYYGQAALLFLTFLAASLLRPGHSTIVAGFVLLSPLCVALSFARPRHVILAAMIAVIDVPFLLNFPHDVVHTAMISQLSTAIELCTLGLSYIALFSLPCLRLARSGRADSWLVLQAGSMAAGLFILFIRLHRVPVAIGHDLPWGVMFALASLAYGIASIRYMPIRGEASQLAQKLVGFLFGLLAVLLMVGQTEAPAGLLAFLALVMINADMQSGFYKYYRIAHFAVAFIAIMVDVGALVDLVTAQPGDVVLLRLGDIIRLAVVPAVLLGFLGRQLRHAARSEIAGPFADADLYALGSFVFQLLTMVLVLAHLQGRHAFGGNDALWLPALFTLAAGGAALILLQAGRINKNRPISTLIILRGYAVLAVMSAIISWLVAPVVSGQRIEGGSVLLLAALYLAPSLMAALALRAAWGALPALIRQIGIGFVSIEIWIWLSLSIVEIYNGKGDPLDFTAYEIWSFSAVWMLYAAGLIALGLTRRLDMLRYAGIAMMGLTAVKVLLIDTTSLGGLARVGSLFCLGIVLMLVGAAYQNYAKAYSGGPDPT